MIVTMIKVLIVLIMKRMKVMIKAMRIIMINKHGNVDDGDEDFDDVMLKTLTDVMKVVMKE